MIERPNFSIAGRTKAFGYAWRGLVYAIKIGHAFWLQTLIAAVVIAVGLYLHLSLSDWRWIALAIALVLTTEIMNTAVETVCDALHPDHHPLIGLAKDVAAGAVLMSGFGAIAIGLLTLWPYVF
ncbi:MAG: diacylglycerol kinase family protein [Alphaproteobacteria bacterium]|nr:diacylglycerol kinase family protein [Alphaproteobacteria bacterium]